MVLSGMMIVTSLITAVVMIFINALLLMVSTKIFKVADTSYKSALYVTAIVGVVGFLIGLIGLTGIWNILLT